MVAPLETIETAGLKGNSQILVSLLAVWHLLSSVISILDCAWEAHYQTVTDHPTILFFPSWNLRLLL
jgi:uncharacterized membrane protein